MAARMFPSPSVSHNIIVGRAPKPGRMGASRLKPGEPRLDGRLKPGRKSAALSMRVVFQLCPLPGCETCAHFCVCASLATRGPGIREQLSLLGLEPPWACADVARLQHRLSHTYDNCLYACDIA